MENEDERIRKTLTKETRRVYDYLVKRYPDEVTLAELSNHLDVTKPAVLHHIDKLKLTDLIEQTVNGYRAKQIVRIPVLKIYRTGLHRLLTAWLLVTILFAFLFGISIMLMAPFEFKIFNTLLSLFGLIISVFKMLEL